MKIIYMSNSNRFVLNFSNSNYICRTMKGYEISQSCSSAYLSPSFFILTHLQLQYIHTSLGNFFSLSVYDCIVVFLQDVRQTEKINKSPDIDFMYTKALYYALPMDYMTVAKLQTKLDGEAKQNTVRKLIDKIAQDGYLKSSGSKRLGIHPNYET
ncbi:uncharacterized protein LOC109843062 [Asparagus officinalis]|uniref:uncharacterized protein LOC109843062 n=1 Tax=Asparagus officinalis TaxID=4686 RepID=UPI00098E19A8|nr:uncharacterized protein LOC109843062 [Asparagus officinalis]